MTPNKLLVGERNTFFEKCLITYRLSSQFYPFTILALLYFWEMEQPRKRTRELISLIDTFELQQEDKNRLKNVLGVLDHVGSVFHLSGRDNLLGILSPFSRTTSATSTMTCEAVNTRFQREVIGKTSRGTLIAIKGSCFTLLEMKSSERLQKQSSELISILALEEDPYNVIMKAMGCECCALDNCPIASGLRTTLIRDKDNKFGISLLCTAHFAGISDGQTFDMPSGAHVYLFTDDFQTKLDV